MRTMSLVFALLLGLLPSLGTAQVVPPKKLPPNREKHAGPTPAQLAKNMIASPFKDGHFKFPRGMKRTPTHKILLAPRFKKTKATPSQVIMLPKQISMWGNDVDGDCVSASEACRIAAWSINCGLPETFIPDANLISWASAGGYLNGANLTDVMSDRQTRGMADASGKLYLAGPYATVNYADETELQAALAVGPVNFGIDANALPSGAGNDQGWYAFGGSPGQFSNEDHCTPSLGFLTGATSFTAAFQAISQVYGVTVTPPANAPKGNVYLWFTWSTVGVVDFPWIMSCAGEAWVQSPTTVGQTPSPSPSPSPTPTPTPTPSPAATGTLIVQVPGLPDVTTTFPLPPAPTGTVITPTMTLQQVFDVMNATKMPAPPPAKKTSTLTLPSTISPGESLKVEWSNAPAGAWVSVGGEPGKSPLAWFYCDANSGTHTANIPANAASGTQWVRMYDADGRLVMRAQELTVGSPIMQADIARLFTEIQRLDAKWSGRMNALEMRIPRTLEVASKP